MARAYSPPPRRYGVSQIRPAEGTLFWVQPLPIESRLLERNEQRARIEPLMRQSILARERFLRVADRMGFPESNAALEVLVQADQAVMTALSEDLVRQYAHDQRLHELLSSINERLAYLEELEISRTLPLPESDLLDPEDFMWPSRNQLPPIAPDIRSLRTSDGLRAHLEFLPTANLDYAVRYNLEHLLRLHFTGTEAIPDLALRKAMYAAFFAEAYCAWYFVLREHRNMSHTHYSHFWRNVVSLLPDAERRRAARVFLAAPSEERHIGSAILARAINTAFECDIPTARVREFAEQHIRSYKCIIGKDYTPTVRTIYEYVRNFQLWIHFAREHDPNRCSVFTGGLAEVDLVRIFIDNIEPRTTRIAQHLRCAVEDKPDMLLPGLVWNGQVFDTAKDLLQRHPETRVHYDPPVPDLLRPFAAPVDFSPVFPSPTRPGQPTTGDLFCHVCFTHHVETLGRRTTRADVLATCTLHDTEYCPRVLGVWDPANPLCNPGPAVTTHDALANCLKVHFPIRRL